MDCPRRQPSIADTAGMPSRGEVFTVVSGKGGVGKTNLAVNLAVQLSRRGSRVVLVDADFGLANADILLNISALGDISDLFDESRPLEDVLVEGPLGLRVLCGVSGTTRTGELCAFEPVRCVRILERLESVCDVVVIDCGAGLTPAIIAFALAGDRLLLTTTPEPTALTDAYALLKMLHKRGYRGWTGSVVSMASSRREAEGAARRLRRVAKEFLGLSVEDLGYVPRDRHVIRSIRQRVPVAMRYPHCPASAAIEAISRRLSPPQGGPGVSSGVWTRMANLFL